MATRTPQNDESADAEKSVDKEWVSEHARQVSRMLPGGLSVLGVFIISESDAKDTLTTLRQVKGHRANIKKSEKNVKWETLETCNYQRQANYLKPSLFYTFHFICIYSLTWPRLLRTKK
ncbi:hypothetical protein XENOCAPTIV_017757 [Xenoophorus captivus]|uniref:Protein odr-4 homolog n=1 Tax=Xenoophorus captivus TaxID=1517983 RepID=A0ABV0R9A8_9TELE